MQKVITLILVTISFSVLSEETKRSYPKVYPFVPVASSKIKNDVRRMSEDKEALINIFKMYTAGLLRDKETSQIPWVSTYWPLNKGGIADPFKGNSKVIGDITRLRKTLSWKHNYKRLKNRRSRKNIINWSEKALANLAPSEKYDLLLGDMSFDLTNKQLDYMYKWGSKKENGFLTKFFIQSTNPYDYAQMMFKNKYKDKNGDVYRSIDDALADAIKLRGAPADKMAFRFYKSGRFTNFQDSLANTLKRSEFSPSNYVLKEKNSKMALWEGICNGWSTAAGIIPRPLHSFKIKLKNGKMLKFYPDDVKALISQYWFNSLIQYTKIDTLNEKEQTKSFTGGTLMQGLRCNDKSPKKDQWGRFYDSKPDPFSKSKKIEARCVGVHPAIWHSSLVNIIGKQGRSFVVERKIKAAVDNHPMSDYKMKFFNPYTGDSGHLMTSIKPIDENDQFKSFRNKRAKYIVGVESKIAYIDWIRPVRRDRESSKYDKSFREEKVMIYDLELDEDGNIVGGQWRAARTGKAKFSFGKGRKQPDFFWIITKDWKKSGYFDEIKGLTPWTNTQIAPPKDWLEAAKIAHAFKFKKTHAYGWNEKCKVVNKKSGKEIEVPCEYEEDKPQPLINVVNKLLELSRN